MPERDDPLLALQARLHEAFKGRPRQLNWGDPEAMRQSLLRVRQTLGGRQAIAREQRIARGVLAFRILGKQLDFVRLKYVCWGLAQAMDWESRRLLDNREQTQALLEAVASLRRDPRRFTACYRGLLASWQEAAQPDYPLTATSRASLELLQRFLIAAQAALPVEARSPELLALAGSMRK